MTNPIHPNQVWDHLFKRLNTPGFTDINLNLLAKAITRGEKLEQLLRLVNQYKESIDKGRSSMIIRKAIFELVKELK